MKVDWKSENALYKVSVLLKYTGENYQSTRFAPLRDQIKGPLFAQEWCWVLKHSKPNIENKRNNSFYSLISYLNI